MSKTYREAGVDIEKGDRFAEFIRTFESKAVSREIGGFAGGFELDLERYPRPVIMTTTDGVGTKLIIAQKLGVYDTVGIDLVAMCVNDLIASGAEPVSFLDYIACGEIREDILQELIAGIVRGCEQAGCRLTGGETAEMPDMYKPGDFDLAGFAVGVADKPSVLPCLDRISEGTMLYGMASTGIHSNGLSLARKALPMDNEDLLRKLLVPTRIYVKEIMKLLGSGAVAGVAHITGGGLEGNIQRTLPENLAPALTYDWHRPEVFLEIQNRGGIAEDEMRRVFNLGLGMVIAVPAAESGAFEKYADEAGIAVIQAGEVTEKTL